MSMPPHIPATGVRTVVNSIPTRKPPVGILAAWEIALQVVTRAVLPLASAVVSTTMPRSLKGTRMERVVVVRPVVPSTVSACVIRHVRGCVSIRASMPANNCARTTVLGPAVLPVEKAVPTLARRIVIRTALRRQLDRVVVVAPIPVPPTALGGVAATSVGPNRTVLVTTTAVLVASEQAVLPCVCSSALTSAPLVWRRVGSNAVLVVRCVVPVVKLPVTSTVRKSVRTAVPITVSTTVPNSVVVVPISVTLALACALVSVPSSVNRAVPIVPTSVPGGVTPVVVRVVLPIVPSSVSRLVPTVASAR